MNTESKKENTVREDEMMTDLPLLGMAFSQEPPVSSASSEKNDKRVEKLLERLSKVSPLGKQVVDKALEKGVQICMDDDMGNRLGTYYPAMNMIGLNEKSGDSLLLAVLVHEARHAGQTMTHDHTMTVHSAVAVVRALEADAMAHECAAVYQMKKAEPQTYRDFCEYHSKMMTAYEKEFTASKDMDKALGEAFKSWYDNKDYIRQYDNKTLEFMDMGFMFGGAYKKEIPAEEIAKGVCSKGNKTYVEPEFFYSERASTITERQAQEAHKIEKGHIRHTFHFEKIFGKIPTSAGLFYVRGDDGTVRAPEQKQPSANRAAAMKKAAAARQGR